MKTYPAELAYPAQCAIGEGPMWHAARQKLYWVAIFDHAIHEFDPATGVDRTIPVGQYAGCVAATAGSRLITALHHGFHWLDPETGMLEKICDPEAHLPGNRFNDGAVDPAGRLWAGTIALDTQPAAASLYRLDPDLTTHTMLRDVTISNGLAWSPDARTMYYIDTPTHEVSAFDYDIDSSAIQKRRAVITIDPQWGHPDGMTIDTEGMLWVALWGSSSIVRFDPATGRPIATVKLPVTDVTSCEFGGPNLNQLYITTAREFVPADKLKAQPHAGDLFVAEVDVPGLPGNIFATHQHLLTEPAPHGA